MIFRDLEKVRSIIKMATDLDISYAYDDLVFPEHAAFLIQFDDLNKENYYCYFHKDCENRSKDSIFTKLTEVCTSNNKTIELKGNFNLKQKAEEVEICFL
jgi:hypothetical protein